VTADRFWSQAESRWNVIIRRRARHTSPAPRHGADLPGRSTNGLRSLARDGFLEEAETEAQGGRPARTTFQLTGDGRDPLGDIFANPNIPDTVAEDYRLGQARLGGEAAWARQLRGGQYWFDGEPSPPWSSQPPGGAQTTGAAVQ
jgi:hypothetical protein